MSKLMLKNQFFNLILIVFISNVLANGQTSDSNKLTTLVIVTKHAEKGIETSYPTDPYLNDEKAFPNGPDRLTNKGREDCVVLGKLLKEKYGKHFKRGNNDLFAVVDERPFGTQTAQLILSSLFGWSSTSLTSIGQSVNHKRFLFGPDDCPVLQRRIRRTLRSSQVKNLFQANKQLIQNITGSSQNNAKLIRNVPIVYESIETELNNYLKQPTWLNDTAVNRLKEITKDLDRIYYENELINQLQVGQFLEMIRMNFIDNVLGLPNIRLDEVKLAYLYVVGSDQFSALLNALNIYNGRPKFASSLAIELDDQSNIKVNFYDSNKKEFNEQQISCDTKGDDCKLVPFLNKLDRLIPIDIKKSCVLPKPRLIQPNYNDVFNRSSEANRRGSSGHQHSIPENESSGHQHSIPENKSPDQQHSIPENKSPDQQHSIPDNESSNHQHSGSEEDSIDDESDDDTDLVETERRARRKERIRKFVQEKFDEMINKNKELISWLSDLFVRRAEARREQRDSIDELRDQLIEILKEKIRNVDNLKERKKLNKLLEKFKSNQNDETGDKDWKLDSKSIMENFGNQIEKLIHEKEMIKQKQQDQLIGLIEKVKEFSRLNVVERTERMREFSKKINDTIVEKSVEFNEKLDDLRTSVANSLEDKFSQIKQNFNQERLNEVLHEIETKFRNQLEERKLKREERLTDIRNRLNELVNDLETPEVRKSKLNELKMNIKNLDIDDKEAKSNVNVLEHKNVELMKASELIEQLPNQPTIDIKTTDDATNEERLRIERIKEKLKKIESDLIDYLERNKDNKKQIEEDIVKFNDYLHSNKKISVGLLTRLARSCQNDTIKESIKEVLKDAIDVFNLTNHNILTVETDLSTLINEIEKTTKDISNKQFNVTTYSTKLNESKRPIKLLRAESPMEPSSGFSGKVFGITIAIVAGTMLVIALVCLILRKYQKRKNYSKF